MSGSRRIWLRPEAKIAALVAAVAVFLGAWALLHTSLLPPPLSDTPVYERYATAVRAGEVPYRDFPLEYPPGALPVFVAPAYVGGYAHTFGWLMAGLGVCCLLLVAAAGARWWGMAFVAASPLLLGTLALSRFDLWPATLAAAAMAALVHDRHRLGWAALGAAVGAKLYPAVLVPLALGWTLRRRGARELFKSIAVGTLVVALVFLPFLVLSPDGLWHSLSIQLRRPLQIESLGASILTVSGHPRMVGGFGSQNLAGQGAIAAASSAAVVASLAALWVAFARGPAERERLVRFAAACVCAFVALGKVLSPQFLIWLVPLVPLVRGRRGVLATGLLGAALIATQVWFPERYWEYANGFELAGVVLARNLLLVALLLALVVPGRAPRLAAGGATSRWRPRRRWPDRASAGRSAS
jgi:hypothetical protein